MGDLSIPGKNSTDNKIEMEHKDSNSSAISYFPQCILSNVKAFVEQQQNIFELMWQKAISAEQRIRETKHSKEPEVIDTIKYKEQIQNLSFSLLESANEEIFVIFSTSNEFHRLRIQISPFYYGIIFLACIFVSNLLLQCDLLRQIEILLWMYFLTERPLK